MNIIQIAEKIVADFKENHNSKDCSVLNDVLYIAIDKDGKAVPSIQSSILDDAFSAIVITAYSEKAINQFYTWYKIFFINTDGGVERNFCSNDFTITSGFNGKYVNQELFLSYKGKKMYSTPITVGTWGAAFIKVWTALKVLTACKEDSELREAVNKINLS